jgi:uncharacterized Zn-binding protein involved in type VI secretion
MTRVFSCLLLSFAVATPALAENAARVGDSTSHGGNVTGPGVLSVQIEGHTAVVVGDQTTCPLFDGLTPHVGGPIVSGSTSVLIGGKPAARVGDVNAENNNESAAIVTGATTVNIGP